MWLLPSGNDLREPDYIAEWQQSKTEVYEVGNQGSTEIYSGVFWQGLKVEYIKVVLQGSA